jgi:hypothetical protein
VRSPAAKSVTPGLVCGCISSEGSLTWSKPTRWSRSCWMMARTSCQALRLTLDHWIQPLFGDGDGTTNSCFGVPEADFRDKPEASVRRHQTANPLPDTAAGAPPLLEAMP